MINKINGQIIASTLVDSQGEKLSKDDLIHIKKMSESHSKMKIGTGHNLLFSSQGYFDNFRIVESETNNGEYVLKADVHFNESKDELLQGGFSWSLTELLSNFNEDMIVSVFFPFPYYTDDEFLKEIDFNDKRIGIGSWKKKSAELSFIGLIFGSACFFFAPAWDSYYKANIEPLLSKIFSKNKHFSKEKLSFDYVQNVMHPKKYSLQVYFIMHNIPKQVIIEPFRFRYGLHEVQKYINNNIDSEIIMRIKMIFLGENEGFQIWCIEYANGEEFQLFDH